MTGAPLISRSGSGTVNSQQTFVAPIHTLFTVSCLLEKCDSFKAQLLFLRILRQKPLRFDPPGTRLMQGFVFRKKYGLKFRSAESFVQSLH